jgi:hypothetical protein
MKQLLALLHVEISNGVALPGRLGQRPYERHSPASFLTTPARRSLASHPTAKPKKAHLSENLLLLLTQLIVLLVVPFVVSGQTPQATPPPPAQPRSGAFPKPVEQTLPNGLRVIVIERTESPLVSGHDCEPADQRHADARRHEDRGTDRESRRFARVRRALGFIIRDGRRHVVEDWAGDGDPSRRSAPSDVQE